MKPRFTELALVGGGASVALLAALWIAGVRIAAASRELWVMLYLVSLPHFMASYWMFYRDRELVRAHAHRAWLWPAALGVSLAGITVASSPQLFACGAILIYGWLLWHYSRQAFGIALRLGRPGGASPSPSETSRPQPERAVLLALTSLLALQSYLTLLAQPGGSRLFGAAVPPLAIPAIGIRLAQWASFSALGIGGLWLLRRPRFSRAALLPVAALALWLSPPVAERGLVALLPLFHGAQYLPLCHRRLGEKRDWLLWLLLTGSGALLFVALPSAVRGLFPGNPLGERAAIAILLFLNAHHYTLDAVLWKARRRPAERVPIVWRLAA